MRSSSCPEASSAKGSGLAGSSLGGPDLDGSDANASSLKSACLKLLACAGPVLIVAGCASSARPLPAYVDRSEAPAMAYVPARSFPVADVQPADSSPSSAPAAAFAPSAPQTYLVPAAAARPPAPPPLRPLMVSRNAWSGLAAEEQDNVRQRYRVAVIEDDRYGIIVDNQGVDESTPGTTGGAALGAAVGSAMYIDRAFSGNNHYSAVAQIGVGIIGAIIGSTLDRPAVTQYRFRYTVRLGDGDIQYLDEVKGGPFRHSVGVCLLVPDIELISQQVCNHTTEQLRSRYVVLAR